LLAACSSSNDARESEDAAQKQDAVDCGYYPPKEGCDPQKVVDYILSNARADFLGGVACLGCGQALVDAGAIAATGEVEAVPLVWTTLEGTAGCMHCTDFLEESGILDITDCWFTGPCAYSEDARQKECEDMCGYNGQLGFVAQLGYACICTSDPQEQA